VPAASCGRSPLGGSVSGGNRPPAVALRRPSFPRRHFVRFEAAGRSLGEKVILLP